MRKHLRLIAALFTAVLCTANPSYAQYFGPANLNPLATNSKIKNNVEITGNLTVDGATTNGVPLTAVSVENAIKSKVITVDVGPTGALTNGATYSSTTPIGFACTLIGIYAAAHVAPVGGTNTVVIKKSGSANLLASTNFNPTTLVSLTAQSLPLTTTAASLTLAATDTLDIVWVAGTQTTAANGPCFSIIVVPTTDF